MNIIIGKINFIDFHAKPGRVANLSIKYKLEILNNHTIPHYTYT